MDLKTKVQRIRWWNKHQRPVSWFLCSKFPDVCDGEHEEYDGKMLCPPLHFKIVICPAPTYGNKELNIRVDDLVPPDNLPLLTMIFNVSNPECVTMARLDEGDEISLRVKWGEYYSSLYIQEDGGLEQVAELCSFLDRLNDRILEHFL